MVGATIVEFCKRLLDGDRLIIEDFVHQGSLDKWATGFEVFPFQIIIYKHIYRSNVMWYDKPANHII